MNAPSEPLESQQRLAAAWLEAHLESSPLDADEAPIRAVHGRATAFLDAFSRALAGEAPHDWGSFSHREAVQLIVMMATALAESEASAAAAGSLVPSLGCALERLGSSCAPGALAPLAAVASETYTTARLEAVDRAHQRRLAETTPIVELRRGLLLVAPVGAPERETAEAIVERVARRLLAARAKAPVVLLDLTAVTEAEPPVIAALLGVIDEVAAVGGTCGIVADAARLESMDALGVELRGAKRWATVAEGLAELWPEGLIGRIRRSLTD